jgi:bifunctional non-homologous end joining protein LigD
MKRAAAVPPGSVAGVTVTHPERIVFPQTRITKLDVARYYAAVAGQLLADVAGRPLSIVRCPRGIGGPRFFQRHYSPGLGAHIYSVDVVEKSGRPAPYLYIDDVRGLLELAQMDTIELHAWGARAANPDRPDRVIFDLDPAPGIAWPAMIAAAAQVRRQLQSVKLESFVRLTGGKGLHIVAPFTSGPSWTEVSAFCKSLAARLVEEQPAVFVATAAKARRTDHIFIDWLRNSRGATSIANWSLRARPGAPAAMPLRWEEFPATKSGGDYDLSAAQQRAQRRARNPWARFTRLKQRLPGPSARPPPRRASSRQ